MEFEVGCGLEEFKRYARRNGVRADLAVLEKILSRNPSCLIVWREDAEVVGHAIWHESNTDEHRKGDPRDEDDRAALRRLLGGKRDFIELHEVWLLEEYRGKGYGERFFEFFEKYMQNRGYDRIIFCAHHPAALAICRKRGYKGGGSINLDGVTEYVFYLPLRK